EVNAAPGDAHEHHAPADGRVHQVEVEVAGGVPGEGFVAAGDVLRPAEVGPAGQPELLGDVVECPTDEDHPCEVHLPGSQRGHLPVQDGHRPEAAVHDVADPGVAPAEHRRAFSGGPVVLQP